jgi:hypothetical protein
MEMATAEVSIKGRLTTFPCVRIDGREIVITGSWLKIAIIKDEEWSEKESVRNPELFLTTLRQTPAKPDVFVFSQSLDETQPRYNFHLEWDNAAAIPLTTFSEWWEGRLPQVTRKNVRRSAKRGVVVRLAPFDDTVVEGITRIYNETPIRQGRRFWHYGKDCATVKRENSSYLDRSDFIIAYHKDEIIGFIKIVHVGKIARIMQIVSMNGHFDKRPANALLAFAVEHCCQKGSSHLVYGKYMYGNKVDSPISEFKRRNGFEQVNIPTYYLPLTAKGRMAVALNLHRGLQHIVPPTLTNLFVKLRAKVSGHSLGSLAEEKSEAVSQTSQEKAA